MSHFSILPAYDLRTLISESFDECERKTFNNIIQSYLVETIFRFEDITYSNRLGICSLQNFKITE